MAGVGPGAQLPSPHMWAWSLVFLARIWDLPIADETAEGEAAGGDARPGPGREQEAQEERGAWHPAPSLALRWPCSSKAFLAFLQTPQPTP